MAMEVSLRRTTRTRKPPPPPGPGFVPVKVKCVSARTVTRSTQWQEGEHVIEPLHPQLRPCLWHSQDPLQSPWPPSLVGTTTVLPDNSDPAAKLTGSLPVPLARDSATLRRPGHRDRRRGGQVTLSESVELLRSMGRAPMQFDMRLQSSMNLS